MSKASRHYLTQTAIRRFYDTVPDSLRAQPGIGIATGYPQTTPVASDLCNTDWRGGHLLFQRHS
jgi:hypothetical protein